MRETIEPPLFPEEAKTVVVPKEKVHLDRKVHFHCQILLPYSALKPIILRSILATLANSQISDTLLPSRKLIEFDSGTIRDDSPGGNRF